MSKETNLKMVDVVPLSDETDERLPTLTIEGSQGEIIRIYQVLAPEFIREMIGAFCIPRDSKI